MGCKENLEQKLKSLKETIDKLHNVYTEDELLLSPTIYLWHKAYWEGGQSFTLQKSIITQINVNTTNPYFYTKQILMFA